MALAGKQDELAFMGALWVVDSVDHLTAFVRSFMGPVAEPAQQARGRIYRQRKR